MEIVLLDQIHLLVQQAGSYKALVASTFTTVLLSFGCGIDVDELDDEGCGDMFCSIEFIDIELIGVAVFVVVASIELPSVESDADEGEDDVEASSFKSP